MFIHQTQSRPSGPSSAIQTLPLPLGKRGFQPTLRLRKTGTLSSRDQPPGGASKLALQQERVWADTRKNFLPLRERSAQRRKGNLIKYYALSVRTPGKSEFPFLTPTMRLHDSQAPLPTSRNNVIIGASQRESRAGALPLSQLHRQLTMGTWADLLCCSGPQLPHL